MTQDDSNGWGLSFFNSKIKMEGERGVQIFKKKGGYGMGVSF